MSQQRQYSHDADQSGIDYEIEVGGTVDGESMRDVVGYGNYSQVWENNLSMRMENVGDDIVRNPWIHVDGQRDWYSLERILEGILTPDMTDGEKAREIWEFARRHRYHSTTADDEVKDTVKMLNVYGYTLCWDEAYTLSNLWQAADLPIRRGLPHGHCTTEVFYDDAWHLLDSDEHLLVLDRDNETIVGEAEISHDHDLMKRSHAYGINSVEERRGSEEAASLFCHAGPRSGGRPQIGQHHMDLTLRPGEALVWAWGEGRGLYHGQGEAPPRFCNGQLEWDVPMNDAGRWAESTEQEQTIWRLQPPYVVVGGRIEVESSASVSWQLCRDGGEWIDVTSDAAGPAQVDLDPFFPPDSPATHDVQLRLRGSIDQLNRLRIELTLQMAPLSLPALHVGTNRIRYTDESSQRQVRLTHTWLERDDVRVPTAPEPISPSPGEIVAGTAPTFSWRDTAGPDGDYHFRLCTDADMRRVLSPVFEKVVSRTPAAGTASWTVPEEGLLNPEVEYQWHVRARSRDGVWGPWSTPAAVRVQAPGVPLEVTLDMDWDQRCGTLRWKPNPTGTAPVRYEIYGSDERGFSVSREPYTIVSGDSDPEGTRQMPANLLDTMGGTCAVVVGTDPKASNAAFYRVVAVDADGVRSGPSAYAEAPRPFVWTALPSQVPADEVTTVTLQSIRCLGDLRCVSDGPHRYRKAIRDGDDLEYLLDEGPAFVALDSTTGQLRLTPDASHASTHTITVRVRNGQGGADVVGFDLEVER